VLTASDDNTARLWDVSTGEVLRTLLGHGRAVTSVAFSPDGRRVLTASQDSTARLWDAATGEVLRRFEGHGSVVTSVAFSPDGRSVLLATDACAQRIFLDGAQPGEAHTRVFVHGTYAPSTALFDMQRNLLDCDNEAADTWLRCMASGSPEPIEQSTA